MIVCFLLDFLFGVDRLRLTWLFFLEVVEYVVLESIVYLVVCDQLSFRCAALASSLLEVWAVYVEISAH